MAESSDSKPSVCPRCGESFGCGAASATPCACTRIRLTEALRAQLRESYSDCLCPRCLVALGGEPLAGPMARASVRVAR